MAYKNPNGPIERTRAAWHAMRTRCKPDSQSSYLYADRGIKVCRRWRTFDCFIADMGTRPLGKSLDRRDNSKGYNKANCRWATPRQQAQNTRQNVLFTLAGVTLCLEEWCRRKKVPRERVRSRLRKGMSFADALTVPEGNSKFGFVEYQGKTMSLKAACLLAGIAYKTVWARLKSGESMDHALFRRSRLQG